MNIKFFSFDRLKKYVLIKKSFKVISAGDYVVWATPKINVESININYDRYENEICKFIKEFEYILTNVIEGIDLSLFYNHINELSFERKVGNISEDDLFEYEGVYSLKNNKIVYQNWCSTVLGHELFHMASSIKIDDKEFIGFMQTNDNGDIGIGVGLNEGYTQMLTERYVEKEDYPRYPLTQFFVKKIEDIVGKENIEKMYFKADLEGLVSFLEKYNTRNNVLRFINMLDIVTTYEKIYNSDMVDKKLIQYFFKKAFKDMSNFLFCTLMNKINIEQYNPEFDARKLNEMGNSFISEFLGNLYYQNKEYTLLTGVNLIKYSVKAKRKKNNK